MPWKVLFLLPLFALVLLLGSALSANRSDDLLPYFVVDHPQAKPIAWDSLWRANTVALDNLFKLRHPGLKSELPSLDLFVGDGTLKTMLKAKLTGSRAIGRGPGGDRPYFPAYYIDESEQLQKAKVGLRGWGLYHHSPRKPSLRVKIRRQDVALGHRYVELQRPESVVGLINYLPEQVALKHGVLTSISNYVRLFINRKYKGVYLRSSRPGEALTLALGRLPGPYFKGDALGNYNGADIWAGTEAWRIFEGTEAGTEYFNRTLQLLAQTKTPQNLNRLREFLDFEAFAKWQAVMIVMGSLHTDNLHNHLYFLDPLKGKSEPVLWDVNGVGGHLPPDTQVGRVPNHIIGWMMYDPAWIHQRDQWILRLLKQDCEPQRFATTVEELWRRLSPDLLADPFLAEPENTPFQGVTKIEPLTAVDARASFDKASRWMSQREQTLRSYLNDARVSIQPHDGGSMVTVYGSVAVSVKSHDAEHLLFPGRIATTVETDSLVDSTEARLPAPLSYHLEESPDQLVVRNAVTGEEIQPASTVSPNSVPTVSFHPDQLARPRPKDLVLGPGLIEVRETVRVEAPATLTVRPGTTLSMAPGVSLISTGPAHLRGTPEQPIVIRPRRKNQPWGCLAVVGPATEGTRLEHLTVEGGSLARFRGIDFKGMVNIYNCPDLKLRHCTFGANLVSDDAVNIAGSRFLVEDCRWVESRSDGFDSDMSQGVVRRCQFLRTGNDGLDLMTSSVQVQECQFQECGDKGISVGEGSRAWIQQSGFQKCQIGSEVKDDSRAYFQDCFFDSNPTALNAYRKKWLYHLGGRIFLDRCRMKDNPKSLTLDRRSQAQSIATPVEPVAGWEEVTTPNQEWTSLLKELTKLDL